MICIDVLIKDSQHGHVEAAHLPASSVVFSSRLRREKISPSARGRMPGFSSLPMMVKVLPAFVTPYAKSRPATQAAHAHIWTREILHICPVRMLCVIEQDMDRRPPCPLTHHTACLHKMLLRQGGEVEWVTHRCGPYRAHRPAARWCPCTSPPARTRGGRHG